MYMFYYFIRIAREIFGRRKLQRILLITAIIVGAYFVMSRLGAFAYTGLEGNDDYTDPNNSIFKYYDSYLDDLAVRLFSSSSDDAEDLVDRLTFDRTYSFLVIYGLQNEDQNNTYQYMQVLLFSSDTTFNDSSYANNWHNMNCQVVYARPTLVYTFDNNSCTRSNGNDNYYFPRMLVNRYNMNLINVLSQLNNTDTQSIVGALNNQTTQIQNQTSAIGYQTDKIEDQTQSIEAQTEALESTDYDENSVDIDTSDVDNIDNSEYTGLFTTIFNSFNNAISSTAVEYLRIPLPHSSGEQLTIPSNLVSKHITGALATLVSGFWYFIFGFYAFKFVNNLIIKIKDGTILDGITSNEVITSDMV